MFERCNRHLRTTLKQARTIATNENADRLEVQHLLLAAVEHPSPQTATALRNLGLSGKTVREALDQEFMSALSAVSVSVTRSPERRRVPKHSIPRWGQSSKLALERTLEVATTRGDTLLDDRHLVLAIAKAEAGVAPLLFETLGITRDQIESAFE
jgi:ATP-dependent Clp protease ATP-binding subunit ClpA